MQQYIRFATPSLEHSGIWRSCHKFGSGAEFSNFSLDHLTGVKSSIGSASPRISWRPHEVNNSGTVSATAEVAKMRWFMCLVKPSTRLATFTAGVPPSGGPV
ncbi:MAG: hypothetical protein AAFN76_14395 [Pseudomonadota bacterium]